MLENPSASVIVPVYNVAGYIDDCLRSLQKQTYRNLEIILVNDGSTDASPEICNSYVQSDSRFVLIDKKNGGLSDARNFGVKHAKGLLITFVDSDDVVDEDYVEYLVSLIVQNRVNLGVCQHRTLFTNHSVEEHRYTGPTLVNAEYAIERMLYHDQVDTSAWAKIYDRRFFENIEYPVGNQFEDIATTYRYFIKAGQIAIGSDSKYSYRYRSDSIVNRKFSLKKFDLVKMTKKMTDDVDRLYPRLKKGTLRRRLYSEISTLNQMLTTSEYIDLKKKLVRDIRRHGVEVIFNRKAPNRDKVAIILIYLGIPVYAKFWKLYLQHKKGLA